MAAITIPGGKNKGQALADADEATLQYWFDRISAGLAENPDKQWGDKDRAWIAAASAELKRRGIEPSQAAPAANVSTPAPARQQPQQRPPQTAMARSADQPQQIVAGTFSDAAAASRALLEASQKYHLVTPATVVGRLPEGCEVVVSVVQVDPFGPEVYCITGDAKNPKDTDTVGLDRVALAKIAAAAGVTWVSSRRTDDGSHPHYCAWEAIARFPHFDMTSADYPGNVDIDTREDGEVRGAAAEEIRTKARARGDATQGEKQLLELRKFLLRHCESKAMNKAIGNKGVRRSYKRADLKKPFAVARLIFTGHSDDPEARKEFRQMIGQRFLGASHQLFGPPVQVAPPALAAPQHAPVQYLPSGPPPIGMSIDQGGDDYGYEEVPEAKPTPKPAAAPAAEAVAKPEPDFVDPGPL